MANWRQSGGGNLAIWPTSQSGGNLAEAIWQSGLSPNLAAIWRTAIWQFGSNLEGKYKDTKATGKGSKEFYEPDDWRWGQTGPELPDC